MPIEVRESNGRAVEVRFTCDKCGKLIGIRIMLKIQAELEKDSKVLCQECKKPKKSNEN